MTQHLENWIRGTGAPPPDALLEGNTGHLPEPLFSSDSWGSDGTQVRLMKLGVDKNTRGGVRLPHLRTVLADGQQIGGPLGVYRGTECAIDPTGSDFILHCQLSGDFSIYNITGGTFKPYTEFNPDLCSSFYDSHEAYVGAVTAAAQYAADRGWVLAAEVGSLIQSAEDMAGVYPGCAPAP